MSFQGTWAMMMFENSSHVGCWIHFGNSCVVVVSVPDPDPVPVPVAVAPLPLVGKLEQVGVVSEEKLNRLLIQNDDSKGKQTSKYVCYSRGEGTERRFYLVAQASVTRVTSEKRIRSVSRLRIRE